MFFALGSHKNTFRSVIPMHWECWKKKKYGNDGVRNLEEAKRNTKTRVEKYFQVKVALHDSWRERKMANSNSSSSGEEEMVVDISNNDQVANL